MKSAEQLLSWLLGRELDLVWSGYLSAPHNTALHESDAAKRGGGSGLDSYCPHCFANRLSVKKALLMAAWDDDKDVLSDGKTPRRNERGKQQSRRDEVIDELNAMIEREEKDA